ncbi:MAG: ATP-binding protein, partial [Lachnospiraceae bacterium]|nr:ATP-binding protein [Lachnospiraceae bacterium]
MVEYGIRFVINIFDLCIYWRALEAFVGKRKTSVEFAIALLVVSEAAGSLINQMGINWLNLIAMAVILGLFICQYEEKASAKVIIVLMYMGLVAVAEPAGYVIYTFFEKNQVKNEAILYYSTAFAMELFRAVLIEVFCRFKMGKSLRISAMPKEVVYMLVLIPIASFMGCFLLIEVAQELLSTQTATLCMSIIFTIIIMNYLVFLMIERYTDMAEKRHEEEMVLSETAYWKEYYADMERYQEQILEIKHDLKNRLSTLYDAAGHGD